MAIPLKKFVLCSFAAALVACGGDDGIPPLRNEPLANTYAYRPNTPIAATALRCAKANRPSESCAVAKLPPIAFTTTSTTPSIDNVMDRVLVSHDWMGQRFEQMLMSMPEDIVYLLGGVTAIVIDDDIRPSYYTNLTGAIYLDPAHFWLTQDELRVISAAPDYRAAFARPMGFLSQWRYVIPRHTEGTSGDGSRTLDEIEPNLAALLFHELAHANDIFPRSQYDNIDVTLSIFEVTETIRKKGNQLETLSQSYLSTILKNEQRLTSTHMDRLAKILYAGSPPDDNEKLITAAEVGEHMMSDSANDDYAYTSQYEDLAMLFEETMMRLHYSADRDIAFLNWPASSVLQPMCDDYTVGWGQRNRLGDQSVQPRARWVVEQLLPHRNYSLFFDSLEPPKLIPVGLGWCASETFDTVNAALFQKSAYPAVRPMPFDPASSLRPSELRLY